MNEIELFPPNTSILVVDDMSMMRSMIKNQLRSMGYTNITDVENGKKALDTLKEKAKSESPVQLVISDWNMAVMDGLELLKSVRSSMELKNTPFIMITAEGEVDQVKAALEAGVSSYIRKPFSPAVLREKLMAVWNRVKPVA